MIIGESLGGGQELNPIIQEYLGSLVFLTIVSLIMVYARLIYRDRVKGEKKKNRITHVDRKVIFANKLQIILNMIPLNLEYHKVDHEEDTIYKDIFAPRESYSCQSLSTLYLNNPQELKDIIKNMHKKAIHETSLVEELFDNEVEKEGTKEAFEEHELLR